MRHGEPTLPQSRLNRRDFLAQSSAAGLVILGPGLVALGRSQSRNPESMALLRAVRAGDREEVSRMLARAPELATSVDEQGRSAFVLSHVSGHAHVGEAIRPHLDSLDLVEAVLAEDQERFVAMVSGGGVDVNADHPVGGNAYFAAAKYGKLSMFWPLNRWGGDPNSNPRGTRGFSAFRAAGACANRDLAIAGTRRILVDAGDPNTPQRGASSVLHGAASLEDPELVRDLI